MNHYVRKPKDKARILNSDTDEPIGEASFDDLVRALCKSQRYLQATDVFDGYETRKALLSAKPGDSVPVPDDAWNALVAEAKRPTVLSANFVQSPEALELIRAITDAPSKDPRTEPD